MEGTSNSKLRLVERVSYRRVVLPGVPEIAVIVESRGQAVIQDVGKKPGRCPENLRSSFSLLIFVVWELYTGCLVSITPRCLEYIGGVCNGAFLPQMPLRRAYQSQAKVLDATFALQPIVPV